MRKYKPGTQVEFLALEVLKQLKAAGEAGVLSTDLPLTSAERNEVSLLLREGGVPIVISRAAHHSRWFLDVDEDRYSESVTRYAQDAYTATARLLHATRRSRKARFGFAQLATGFLLAVGAVIGKSVTEVMEDTSEPVGVLTPAIEDWLAKHGY